jgi:hypothetical protein
MGAALGNVALVGHARVFVITLCCVDANALADGSIAILLHAWRLLAGRAVHGRSVFLQRSPITVETQEWTAGHSLPSLKMAQSTSALHPQMFLGLVQTPRTHFLRNPVSNLTPKESAEPRTRKGRATSSNTHQPRRDGTDWTETRRGAGLTVDDQHEIRVHAPHVLADQMTP